MNYTFLSVNCSYSHTSMAYHILKGYADPDELHDWQMVECSINEKVERVLRQLSKTEPDFLLASCYIFNHKELFEILRRYVLVNPSVKVILGGPEFLGNNEELLRKFPWISLIVRGEGEIPLKRVVAAEKYDRIRGLCWIDSEDRYRDNGTADLADMEEVIPHYNKLFDPDRPFVQYETSRGCPNRCTFCTSSLDPVLRYIPLDEVRIHLQRIQRAGIKEVRILDRTFNSKNSRSVELLNMFREEFPELRFHCEVDPAFIQETFFEALELAPKGQMHIETGLQTFSEETYDIVQRIGPMDKTVSGLTRICALPNVEVHADLIGGLPGCTVQSHYEDLMTLFKMKPHEIQLENLKILPGTPLAKREELIHSPTPPYEVLRTDTMTFEDLCSVSNWSKMLDWFYNYFPIQKVFIECCNSDYDFFSNFHKYLDGVGAFDKPLSAKKRFEFFKDYLEVINDSLHLELLAAAWYVAGFSPERGLFPATLYREDDFPENSVFLIGKDHEKWHKRYVYSTPSSTLYVSYSKGMINDSSTSISVHKLAL